MGRKCPGWIFFSSIGAVFMAAVAVVSIMMVISAGRDNARALSDSIQVLVSKSAILQMDRMINETQSTTRALQKNDPAIKQDILPLPNDQYDPSVLYVQMDVMNELPGQGMVSLGYALWDPEQKTKTVYEMSRGFLPECPDFAYGVTISYTNFFYLARCVSHSDGAFINITRLHQSRLVYNGTDYGFSDLEKRVLDGEFSNGVFLPIRPLLGVFTLVWDQPKRNRFKSPQSQRKL